MTKIWTMVVMVIVVVNGSRDLHLGGLVGYSADGSVTLATITSDGKSRSGHTIRESHGHLEKTAFPDRLLLAGNATLPCLEIEDALGILDRSGPKAEGMILSPMLPVS